MSRLYDPRPWTILFLGILSYFGYWLVNEIKEFRSHSEQLKEFETATIHTPSSLMEWLKNNNGSLEGKKIYIEGRVALDKSTAERLSLSTNNDNTLVHKIIFQRDVYSNNYYFGETGSKIFKFRDSVELIKFMIEDEKNESVKIINNAEVEPVDCLDEISVEVKLKELNFAETIGVYLCSGIKILESLLFDNYFDLLQVKIGVEEKTVGIRLGAFLGIYGEVSVKRGDKDVIAMVVPKFFTKDIFCLVSKAKEDITRRKWILGWIVFALALSVFFIRKFYLDYKESSKTKKTKLDREASKPGPSLLSQVKNRGDGTLCIICRTNLRGIVYKPCLHLACCEDCNRKLKIRECPLCHSEIQEAVELYGKK